MLIDAANDAGGRDNITVVLFRLEEVGAGARRAAGDRRAPRGGAPSPSRGGGSGPATATVTAPVARHAAAPRPPRAPRRAGAGAGRASRSARSSSSSSSPAWSSAAYYASQTVYFVGASNDGFVTVYRGLPYDLPAGLNLYSVNYESGVPVDELTPAQKQTVTEHTLRSKDDAQDLVKQLETGELAAR